MYAVTVAKGGPKLTVNDTNPDGNPGYGGGPAGMRVVNSTIAEFISFVLTTLLGCQWSIRQDSVRRGTTLS